MRSLTDNERDENINSLILISDIVKTFMALEKKSSDCKVEVDNIFENMLRLGDIKQSQKHEFLCIINTLVSVLYFDYFNVGITVMRGYNLELYLERLNEQIFAMGVK